MLHSVRVDREEETVIKRNEAVESPGHSQLLATNNSHTGQSIQAVRTWLYLSVLAVTRANLRTGENVREVHRAS